MTGEEREIAIRFSEFLNKSILNNYTGEGIGKDRIKEMVLDFVFSEVKGNIEEKGEIDENCWERTVAFCFKYSFIIYDTLEKLLGAYYSQFNPSEEEENIVEA